MRTLWCKKRLMQLCTLGLAVGQLPAFSQADDLRDAAPPGAFMALYGKHNPERDYQKEHYKAVWEEVQKAKLHEKILQLIQSNLSEADAEKFVAARDALRNAVAPIEIEKLLNTSEVLYAQQFEGPTSLQLILIRVPDGGAESLKAGIVNLMNLASGASEGNVPVASKTIADVEMQYLQMPDQIPFTLQPSVGVKGDVVILTTSLNLAEESLHLLANPSAVSKFDDERVVAALKQLPAAEDAVVFVDGKAMFEQLQGIPKFINDASHGNPEAARLTSLMSGMLEEMNGFDFEVTVEYTDGFRNCSASYGRMTDVSGSKVIGRMVNQQQPFTNWRKWVPAGTNGFSISSGFSILPLYDWAMTTIPTVFPEASDGLTQFEAIQNQFDVHLREDFLEAFPGEYASVNFPGAPTPFGAGSESVGFLRCTKSARIQELIHRGMAELEKRPEVKAQGVSLSPISDMEGFEQLSANVLVMAGGLKPVIGFRDGWMIFGTHRRAVEKALNTQAGEGETFADSDRFKSFQLEVPETVSSISYVNVGENIKAASAALQQAGVMAPMILGMAQAQAPPGSEQAKGMSVVKDIAALLPSVGRIVGKFDFIDATLSTTVAGSEPGTYRRNSVTLIKPPKPKAAEGSSSSPKPSAPK